MRPYIELLIGKAPSINSKNIRKTHIFGGGKSSLLDTRLMSLRFEESDGDDIDRNRKGRKDIVSFTFLDQVPDQPGFVSDTQKIQVQDLLFIRYGWIIGNSGQKITPNLVEREFRVVKIEPKINGSICTVTVTAYDRSVDLDLNVTPFIFEASKSSSTDSEGVPASQILSQIATYAGLELDRTGRVQFQDAEGNTISSFGDKAAIPRESLASYLKYLAQETGALFFVENRRLFFGARKLPDTNKLLVEIVSGDPTVVFNIKTTKDLRRVPLIEMSAEQKVSTQSLSYKVSHQNKRTADIKLQEVFAQELSQILIMGNIGDQSGDVPRPPFKPSQTLLDNSIRLNVPLETARTAELNAEQSAQTDKFLSEPRLFKSEEVHSILRQPSPSARETAGKALLKQKLTDLVMKDVTATVKIFGNPLIRHGQFVKLTGNIPNSFKGNWYVQSVEHVIDANNYFTTLKLLSGSGSNPLLEKSVSDYAKKLSEVGKKSSGQTGPERPDLATGR